MQRNMSGEIRIKYLEERTMRKQFRETIDLVEINGSYYCKMVDVLKIVQEEIRKNEDGLNCEGIYRALSGIKAKLILSSMQYDSKE